MINTAPVRLFAMIWNLIKFMKFARHIQIFHSLYSQDEQEKNYGSIALLSHFQNSHFTLKWSAKFTVAHLNPVARIPWATSTVQKN